MSGGVQISVVLSTYERVDALRVVLRAYNAIARDDFEVLVADDGSGPETAAAIAELARDVHYPLVHIWHENVGFRLAAIRNLALRAARGSVIVFTDGDCIPLSDTLDGHARVCRPGVAHAGARHFLCEDETEAVLQEAAPDAERWRRCGRLERTVSYAKNGIYRMLSLKDRPKLITANAAVHRDDLRAVNGFDERFEGWGYEDEDLARRLRRTGVRVADGQRECLVVHLFHPVHVSHRPSARETPNYRYFHRGRFLTQPVRGLRRRGLEDLRLHVADDAKEELGDCASNPAGPVEVLITKGAPNSVERQRAELVLTVPPATTFETLQDLLRSELEAPFATLGDL